VYHHHHQYWAHQQPLLQPMMQWMWTSQVSGVSSSSPVLGTSTASAAANDAVDVD